MSDDGTGSLDLEGDEIDPTTPEPPEDNNIPPATPSKYLRLNTTAGIVPKSWGQDKVVPVVIRENTRIPLPLQPTVAMIAAWNAQDESGLNAILNQYQGGWGWACVPCEDRFESKVWDGVITANEDNVFDIVRFSPMFLCRHQLPTGNATISRTCYQCRKGKKTCVKMSSVISTLNNDDISPKVRVLAVVSALSLGAVSKTLMPQVVMGVRALIHQRLVSVEDGADDASAASVAGDMDVDLGNVFHDATEASPPL